MRSLKVAAVGVSIALLLALDGNLALAQTTWNSSPGTNEINTPGNWVSGLPSAAVDAHFATSNTTNFTQSGPITIRDISFESGASVNSACGSRISINHAEG
jgi:hypothetical protein